jgi:hypothetical protein
VTQGYFKLQRRFFDHWLWTEERSFSKAEAWIDLLQLAAYAPTKRMSRDKLLPIAEGELIASLRYLSSRWGWGKDKTGVFLKTLESDRMIRREIRQGESFVIILNYKRYAVIVDGPPDTGPDKHPTEARQAPDKREEGKEGRESFLPALASSPVLPPKHRAQPVAEALTDRFPTGNAAAIERIQKWINSMSPNWKARPNWTRAEQEALLGVLSFAMELTDTDWRKLRAYMHCLIPDSEEWQRLKLWQPDSRPRFVAALSDMAGHMDRWEGQCRRLRITINLGSEEP